MNIGNLIGCSKVSWGCWKFLSAEAIWSLYERQGHSLSHRPVHIRENWYDWNGSSHSVEKRQRELFHCVVFPSSYWTSADDFFGQFFRNIQSRDVLIGILTPLHRYQRWPPLQSLRTKENYQSLKIPCPEFTSRFGKFEWIWKIISDMSMICLPCKMFSLSLANANAWHSAGTAVTRAVDSVRKRLVAKYQARLRIALSSQE